MSIKGRILRSTGSFYTVLTGDGDILECRMRGKIRLQNLKNTNPAVVGDHVEIETGTDRQHGLITEIHPRANYIIRKATRTSKTLHILASNIDQALIVVTLRQPRTSTGFIDRFLVTAEAYHIPAWIVFNKSDLYDAQDHNYLQTLIQVYRQCGYHTLLTSAVTKAGTDELESVLKNRTTLMAGHSGVGKSALINCIQPGLNLKTGEISAYHLKGKHTTTFAQMFPLEMGGYIADTPGIKEFGLIDFKKEEVALYFPEMKALLEGCQYYNCTHDHEPGCAVKKAVETGQVSDWRYKNYLNIIHDSKLDLPDWE